MRSFVTRRPNVAAAVLFAVLAIVFVGQGLLPGRTLSNSDTFWFYPPFKANHPAALAHSANPEIDDAPALMQPFVRYTKASLPHIPLWDPHIMTGRPFLANAQSAVFSPFSVPAYVLPFFTALGWIAVLKLWCAGFGTFLLGRALGMRLAGATIAGIVYGFNLWLVTWLVYPHASVWALIPFLLVAVERAIRRPDIRGAAPLAIVVAAQFLCGHPESSFHAMLAATIYFVVRVYALRPNLGRAIGAFVGATALGTALAAVTLLPFAELLLRSADIHQRSGIAQTSKAPGKFILTTLMPDWFGRPTQTPTRLYATQNILALFELARAWYASALALMLGAAALILRPSRGRLLLAALAAAVMMVVFGVFPVFQIVTHLPVFSAGHNTRLTILAILCVALLAGFGLDDLLAREGSRRRQWIVLGVAAALFALPLLYALGRGRVPLNALGHGLAIAWGFIHPRESWSDTEIIDGVRASAVWIWLVVGGAGLAIVALATARRRVVSATVLAVLAGVVIYGDLARAGMGYNPSIKRSLATQPATPAIKLLQTAGTARVVGLGQIPQNALAFNYNLYEPRGYDLPVERRFDHLWRTTMSPQFLSQAGVYPGDIPLSLQSMTAARARILGMMGTRFVIQPPQLPRLRIPGLTLVHAGPDAQVYRNAAEQPRAAVVGAQTVAPTGDAAYRDVIAPGFRIDRVAVTEKPVAGLATTTPARTPPPAGRARIAKVTDDGLVVQARAQRPGMLVVSDAWAPGWQATVDGHSTPVQRVDYVFRGVQLPAGNHRVVFSYHPTSFTIGWIISLLALLGLSIALGVTWHRHRS